MKFLWRTLFYTGSLTLVTIMFCNAWVIYATSGRLIDDVENVGSDIPVAMVLGTSKGRVGGGENLFFTSRMDAAYKLHHHRKIRKFILSGDNETRYYNEPQDMKNVLVGKGVPEKSIILDYAGLRTLDSVVRAKAVFGQQRLIIVTQRFHAYRALFIAQFYGIDAVVFTAPDPDYSNIMKLLLREIIARTNAVLDLYVFGTKPKYVDDLVEITFD